ncbi:hypothetical protein HK102_000187, partial [Quaeritorhiza haematococci]
IVVWKYFELRKYMPIMHVITLAISLATGAIGYFKSRIHATFDEQCIPAFGNMGHIVPIFAILGFSLIVQCYLTLYLISFLREKWRRKKNQGKEESGSETGSGNSSSSSFSDDALDSFVTEVNTTYMDESMDGVSRVRDREDGSVGESISNTETVIAEHFTARSIHEEFGSSKESDRRSSADPVQLSWKVKVKKTTFRILRKLFLTYVAIVRYANGGVMSVLFCLAAYVGVVAVAVLGGLRRLLVVEPSSIVLAEWMSCMMNSNTLAAETGLTDMTANQNACVGVASKGLPPFWLVVITAHTMTRSSLAIYFMIWMTFRLGIWVDVWKRLANMKRGRKSKVGKQGERGELQQGPPQDVSKHVHNGIDIGLPRDEEEESRLGTL